MCERERELKGEREADRVRIVNIVRILQGNGLHPPVCGEYDCAGKQWTIQRCHQSFSLLASGYERADRLEVQVNFNY